LPHDSSSKSYISCDIIITDEFSSRDISLRKKKGWFKKNPPYLAVFAGKQWEAARGTVTAMVKASMA
jgi:hypothetical protein